MSSSNMPKPAIPGLEYTSSTHVPSWSPSAPDGLLGALPAGVAAKGLSPTKGHARFNQLLEEMHDLFARKNAGYAGTGNPDAWANFRHSTGFGISPADGVLVRISDKFSRLQALTRNPANDQVGENRRDSAFDMAVYSLIYICLLEEEEEQKNLVLDVQD